MASDDGRSVGSHDDEDFNEDFEALKRACLLTGTNPSDLQKQSVSTSVAASNARAATSDSRSNSDNDDDDECEDLQLVRDIQKRFAIVTDNREPLTIEPLCSILPGSVDKADDFEDDMEILRAIQRRFASYNADYQKASFESHAEHDGANTLPLESCKDLVLDGSNRGVGHSCNILSNGSYDEVDSGTEPSDLWQDSRSGDVAKLPIQGSSFPQAAQAFIDAIKKNRSCQKLIRSKLLHIESRVEELKELRERVKILKDFQVACRRRTSLALSQKKDARAQLISVSRIDYSSKHNSKKPSPMLYGPAENSQVSKFKETVERSPAFMGRAKWSKEESEKLANGLRQQFQELLLQRSLDLLSDGEGLGEGSGAFDGILASIGDVDFTPEKMRLFLPKVNWDYLASMYVLGRSGPECQARWLNYEDPLINQNPWAPMEDKILLHVVQQKGLRNWIDIATSVGTNRTPFQCLARYQRSLNASIIKREWTEEEDNQLRAAVEAFGEGNWQFVASAIEGRTGTQCSNRWMKTLHPARQRVGRWTKDEDKRLKVAVMLFGPRNWKKIGEFVPGRTQVQCRERWVNSLNPSLNLNSWTEEEDLKLQEAIELHGYCWSKVAACVPPRTDNQCRRRWKVLLPHQVPLLQAARETQKAALISNFVDRESERPALRPDDFVLPSQEKFWATESECFSPGKRNKGSRREDALPSSCSGDLCSMEAPGLANGSEKETLPDNVSTKNRRKRNLKKKKSGGSPDVRIREPHMEDGDSNQIVSCVSSSGGLNLLVTDGDEEISKLIGDGELAISHEQASSTCPYDNYSYGQENDGDYNTGQPQYIQPDATWSTVASLEEVNGKSVNVGAETLQADSSKLHPRWSKINKSAPGISHATQKQRQKSCCKPRKKTMKRAQTSGTSTQKESRKRARVLSELEVEDDEVFPSFCKRRLAPADTTFDYNTTLASYCSSLKKKRSKIGEQVEKYA